LKVLASISKLTTKPIEEHTLPLLYGQLPEMAPDLAATDERDRIRHVLDALSVLCVQPGLFEFLLIRLLHKLETLCLSNNRDSAPDQDFIKRECQLAYGFSFLHAINITLKRKVQEKHVDVPKYFDQVVPRLYGIFIYATSRKESLACDTRLLAEAGSIIEAIVAAMPAECVPATVDWRSTIGVL
jgi:DNA repair/transcription protein MET18/MMS19